VPSAAPSSSDVHARLLLALSALLQELEALRGTKDARLTVALAEHVFDIAVAFSNNMAEEMRKGCVRMLRRKGRPGLDPVASLSSMSTSDHRICYIFSHRRSLSTDHLALSRRGRNFAPTSVRRPATGVNSGGAAVIKRGPGVNGGRAAMGTAAPNVQNTAPSTSRMLPFALRLWEVLNDPTPNVGLNDTTLSLTLFDAIQTAQID
jgi:mediator of RNA polymerase II transcription subunit 12